MASAYAPVHSSTLTAWSDNVPGQLRLRQVIISILAVLVALAGFFTWQSFAQIVQTIGKDSVPSIVAAEKIRTTLANAHTQITNVFLVDAKGAVTAIQAYDKSMASAHDYLVEASQNITYGDDERRPILKILNKLSQYERLVGNALTTHSYSDALGKADMLMRDGILPAAAALDRANFQHLDAAFGEGRHKARLWLYGFLTGAALLAALLVQTQIKLRLIFRRVLSLPLAIGLAALVVSMLLFFAKSQAVLSDISSAKEDAFDSVHVLSQAQALAYTANAQESVFLILHGRADQSDQTALFQGVARQLLSLKFTDVNQLPTDLKTLKGGGLLADELANITYDGEEALARATLKGWLQYVRIDEQIRELEATGHHDEAVALCLGTKPNQSNWVSCPLSLSGFAVLFQPRFSRDSLHRLPSAEQVSEFSNAKLPAF